MDRKTLVARELVRKSGLCEQHAGDAHTLNALEQLETADLAEAMLYEKVSSRILLRLREAGRDKDADRVFGHERFAAVRGRIEILDTYKDDVLGLLDKEARDLGIALWGIKGLAAQKRYTEPNLRDLGDLDLMVASFDAAVDLTERLRELGFRFNRRELPWLKRSRETGGIYGQFSLRSITPERMPGLDLHFGGYSVRHCGLHVLTDVDMTPGLSYFTLQQNMPLMVGNAAGDHRITTKDLNDLAVALTADEIDWRHLMRQLEAVDLTKFFAVMVDEFVRYFDGYEAGAAYSKSELPALLDGVRREVPRPGGAGEQRKRWAVTVRHSYSLGVRHSRLRALQTTVSAARYYWGSLQPKVTRGRGPRPQLPDLCNWKCVRLIPAEMFDRVLAGRDDMAEQRSFRTFEGPRSSLSRTSAVLHTAQGDVVRMPFGDFMPTVYYALDNRLVHCFQSE